MIKDEEEFRKKELDVPDAGIDDRHILRMNEENCNVVGSILNCAVEESALTNGKPDAAKMQPICIVKLLLTCFFSKMRIQCGIFLRGDSCTYNYH